jgi:hypothetical protein
MRPHFACADDTNWSMMGCAPFAELRLPQRERGRVGDAVAVLEAEHGRLGQVAVPHLEARLRLGQVVERHVLVAGLLVHQRGVTLAEGAARAVLAREPDGRALHHQRAEGERLGGGPVDRPVLGHHLAAAVEQRA